MVLRNRTSVLSDDEIVEIIIKYIDEHIYNYAVMIDGEWGCGKTYFVKETLMEAIKNHEKAKGDEEKRPVIYITLYGVVSIQEISTQIMMQSYLEKTGKARGIIQAGGKLLVAASQAVSAFGKDFDIKALSETFAGLLPVKNSILIFDDLERCDCPINEILGYINIFVEQEEMKVILIANEKEIGRSTLQANQEIKYLVAAHPAIKFDDDNKKSRAEILTQRIHEQTYGKAQQISQPMLTDINTVQARAKNLFGQNELYEKIKEKLIGDTIYYQPELKLVLKKLINGEGINDGLKIYLIEFLPFFEKYMIDEEHPNLRTFQFYLSKMQGLYEVISKFEGKGQQAFLKYIIQYCFKICVGYKNGTYKYDWSGNEEYGFKKTGRTDIWGSNLNIRFVDDYIVGSILEPYRAEKILRFYEKEYMRRDNQTLNSLRKLEMNWYLMPDMDVEAEVNNIMVALDEDGYDLNEYTRIINILLRLETIGFSSEMVHFAVLKMKANIKKQKERIYLDRGFSLDSQAEYKERYIKIMNDLQAEADRMYQEQSFNSLEHFLSEGTGWAEDLYDYVRKNCQEICEETGFLSHLHIDKLVAKLSDSKSSDLCAFRSCILQLYETHSSGTALGCERPELIELKDRIEKLDIDSFDKIQRTHIKYLIQNLDHAISLYERNESEEEDVEE